MEGNNNLEFIGSNLPDGSSEKFRGSGGDEPDASPLPYANMD